MSPKESTALRLDTRLLEAMRAVKDKEGIPCSSSPHWRRLRRTQRGDLVAVWASPQAGCHGRCRRDADAEHDLPTAVAPHM